MLIWNTWFYLKNYDNSDTQMFAVFNYNYMPFIKVKPEPSSKYKAMDASELFNAFMVEIGQYTWSEEKQAYEITWPLIEAKYLPEKFKDWKKKKNF